MLGIERNARHWTHLLALRFAEVTDAFGAFIRINLINHRPHEYGFIRAFGFTYIAVDALVCNYERHKDNLESGRFGIQFFL